MAKLLLGKEVATALSVDCARRSDVLKENGITAKLALIRCGEREDDIAYEKSIEREAVLGGVFIEKYVLPETAEARELKELIQNLNEDISVHGCLIFRPLPGRLADAQGDICNILLPEKDVDGCTAASAATVYTGFGEGYPPCTAQACMEMLSYYDIDFQGKNAAVIGRSLVVGRPLAMLLTGQDATVTLCHSRTENIGEICRRADIIICAAGRPGLLTGNMVRPGQTVLDVSINFRPEHKNPDGSLGGFVGDAVYDEVEKIVEAISPVPGGVGRVTSAVLIKHVIMAAERSRE